MKNILRPTKTIIIADVFFSIAFVFMVMFLSAFGFSHTILAFPLIKIILSFIASFFFCFIIYYPLISSIIYIAGSIKKSVFHPTEIFLASIIIILLNPLSVSFVVSKASFEKNSPAVTYATSSSSNSFVALKSCGLKIERILQNSKVGNSGINNGNIILKIEGVEINSVQEIFALLDHKRPGDMISIETDSGTRIAELARDPKDPNHAVLGVQLLPHPCE